MRLKMRIVLFCLVLVSGVEMRADCSPWSRVSIEDYNWFTTPRPLILLDLAITGSESTPLIFSYRRPVIFCTGDTILLEALDSVRTKRTEQWLLRPVRNLLKDSVYHFFSADTAFWDKHKYAYHLYGMNDYTVQFIGDAEDRVAPVILKQPRLVSSEYGVSTCPTISAFTVFFPCADSSRMIVKAVLTNILTGTQTHGYVEYSDSLYWFEETICASPFPVDPDATYHVELTIFDVAGNQTTVKVPGILWFRKHKIIDFSATPAPQPYALWIVLGIVVFRAIAGIFIYYFTAKRR